MKLVVGFIISFSCCKLFYGYKTVFESIHNITYMNGVLQIKFYVWFFGNGDWKLYIFCALPRFYLLFIIYFGVRNYYIPRYLFDCTIYMITNLFILRSLPPARHSSTHLPHQMEAHLLICSNSKSPTEPNPNIRRYKKCAGNLRQNFSFRVFFYFFSLYGFSVGVGFYKNTADITAALFCGKSDRF